MAFADVFLLLTALFACLVVMTLIISLPDQPAGAAQESH